MYPPKYTYVKYCLLVWDGKTFSVSDKTLCGLCFSFFKNSLFMTGTSQRSLLISGVNKIKAYSRTWADRIY